MPIIIAKRIAKDKDVVFLPVDMDYYREVSERIMDLMEEESDIMEQVSIDEAYLDVTELTEGDWDKAIKIAKPATKLVERKICRTIYFIIASPL